MAGGLQSCERVGGVLLRAGFGSLLHVYMHAPMSERECLKLTDCLQLAEFAARDDHCVYVYVCMRVHAAVVNESVSVRVHVCDKHFMWSLRHESMSVCWL